MLRRFAHAAASAPPRRARRLPASTPPAPPRSPRPRPTPPPPTVEEDHFNAPLYTLKAFAIATAVVASCATASVAGVMAYLGVRDTAEFAVRMRTWVAQSMPLLSAKIYRRLTPEDTVEGDPVLLVASTPTSVDHDAAQRRLEEAFDRGGFDAWAEAAAREMEAETEVERARMS